ncbi:MAG: maltose/maltodextrin ABC transporter substrate-binding protein MalE [Halanaerobiales bacterium]
MKKFFSLFLLVCMILSMTGLVMASEEGKLLIWADKERAVVFEGLKDEFEAEYGISVEIQEVAFGEIRDNLSIAGPSGEGPDILIGAHDWLGQLVANGLIEAIELSELKDDFYQVTLDAFTWGDKIYALPYGFESIGLIYNKDLVPEPPKTFEEFKAILSDLKSEEEETYGFVMPQPDPYHTFPFLSATGGYIFGINEEGEYNPMDVGLNNKGAVKGLSYLTGLYEEKLIPYVDYQTMMSLFTSGQVGMINTGPWALADIKAANINYAFTKFPSIDGQTPKPFVGVQGMMISSFSKNKMLAQAFLTDFVATEETMMKLFKLDNRPPAFIPVAEEVSSNPDIAGVLASAADGTPMPSIPEMASVWQAWSDALEVVLTQGQDPEAALDNAVEQIKAAIESAE